MHFTCTTLVVQRWLISAIDFHCWHWDSAVIWKICDCRRCCDAPCNTHRQRRHHSHWPCAMRVLVCASSTWMNFVRWQRRRSPYRAPREYSTPSDRTHGGRCRIVFRSLVAQRQRTHWWMEAFGRWLSVVHTHPLRSCHGPMASPVKCPTIVSC